MSEVISVEILNFLNFGDDEDEDEKQLVGPWQAEWPQAKSYKIHFRKLGHYLSNLIHSRSAD